MYIYKLYFEVYGHFRCVNRLQLPDKRWIPIVRAHIILVYNLDLLLNRYYGVNQSLDFAIRRQPYVANALFILAIANVL